ncbi:hypothetical protein BD779DRAFT_1218307 [Infundibulicybe gibba]|nr:hypothetical protein BD779DRAFT_1218307 [Infundibulicybe gibba]
MSFWYPDNTNRRDRAQQLSNDITVMQQAVVEAKADMEKADERMVPFINEILENHGMKTFDDLKAKLDATLTPEEKKAYDELIERSKRISESADNTLTALSAIAFFSGVTAKAVDITKFLACGHVAETFRSYARAFITLITKGFEAGKAAFQAAARSASLAIDFLEDSSKLAKYASSASKVLKIVSVVGVIADAFILAFSLYEEGKQREALRGAINDLFVRRIISKFYERMCNAIKTQDGLMLSYLLFVTDKVILPEDQAAADKIATRFVKYVTEDWSEINAESCYELLSKLDSSRNSWVKEDPSRESAIEQADQDTSGQYSLVRMFDHENVARVVDKIYIEAQNTDAGTPYTPDELKILDGNPTGWVADMQKIAVSGTLNKERILHDLD